MSTDPTPIAMARAVPARQAFEGSTHRKHHHEVLIVPVTRSSLISP